MSTIGIHGSSSSSLGASALVSSGNSSLTGGGLAAGAVFLGEWEEITGYSEITYAINGTPASAPGTIQFEFHFGDGTATAPSVGASPDVTAGALTVSGVGQVAPHTLVPVARWFRLRYTNGSTVVTEFRLQTLYHTTRNLPLTRFVVQDFTDYDDVQFVRSVGVGKTPDDVYHNSRAGGFKTLSPTVSPLGIAGVYTSDVFDTDHYPTVRLLVASDVAGASAGIKFDWSDTSAFTTVRATSTFTFRSGHTTNGRLVMAQTAARYLRITYTNGGTAQTRFFMALLWAPEIIQDQFTVRQLAQFQTSQLDVTLSAARCDSNVIAGRRTIRLKNMTSSDQRIFFGPSATVSDLTGDELAPGESIEIDADQFTEVWVITDSLVGNCRIAVSEYA